MKLSRATGDKRYLKLAEFYAQFRRKWVTGDTIKITLPMDFHEQRWDPERVRSARARAVFQ